MCLNKARIASKYDKKLQEYVFYGYKAIKPSDFRADTICKTPARYKRNEWLRATGMRSCVLDDAEREKNGIGLETDCSNKNYPAGFHIWLTLNDARKYASSSGMKIYRVAYTNILAQGPEDNYPYAEAVVAEYMYIFGESVKASDKK